MWAKWVLTRQQSVVTFEPFVLETFVLQFWKWQKISKKLWRRVSTVPPVPPGLILNAVDFFSDGYQARRNRGGQWRHVSTVIWKFSAISKTVGELV